MGSFYFRTVFYILVVSCCLLGCGKSEIISKETQESSLQEIVSETQEALLQETVSENASESMESVVAPIEIAVQGMLEKAEEEAGALQKKLTEDTTLKQSDMNKLSNDIYLIWDDLLNELWAVLKESLDEKTMNALLAEQREWITMKESEAKKACDVFNGGSMAPLASNMKAAELTKLRVYELADIISAQYDS